MFLKYRILLVKFSDFYSSLRRLRFIYIASFLVALTVGATEKVVKNSTDELDDEYQRVYLINKEHKPIDHFRYGCVKFKVPSAKVGLCKVKQFSRFAQVKYTQYYFAHYNFSLFGKKASTRICDCYACDSCVENNYFALVIFEQEENQQPRPILVFIREVGSYWFGTHLPRKKNIKMGEQAIVAPKFSPGYDYHAPEIRKTEYGYLLRVKILVRGTGMGVDDAYYLLQGGLWKKIDSTRWREQISLPKGWYVKRDYIEWKKDFIAKYEISNGGFKEATKEFKLKLKHLVFMPEILKK